MLVILCHPDDAPALWLDRELKAMDVKGTAVVSVEQLVYSRSITHVLTGSTEHGTIRLADGRVLRAEAITGLINRVRYVPTQHFGGASPADRDYAAAELHAFLLAWLNGIAGRVLNPARPLALGGGNDDLAAIRHYAAAAGLPTRAWHESTRGGNGGVRGAGAADTPGAGLVTPVDAAATATHVVTVLDHRIFGSLVPADVQAGCRRLAVYLGSPLLQVAFSRSSAGGLQFAHATARVDFHLGGRPLAAAIAKAVST